MSVGGCARSRIEFACDHSPEHCSQFRGAFGAKRGLKFCLRLRPSLESRLQALFTALSQVQFLSAAIRSRRFDLDPTITLQRLDIAAESGPVRDHVSSHFIDGHRTQASELGQNRKLCRTQATWREELIVQLSNVTGSRSQRETVTILCFYRHWHSLHFRYVHIHRNKRICTHAARCPGMQKARLAAAGVYKAAMASTSSQ